MIGEVSLSKVCQKEVVRRPKVQRTSTIMFDIESKRMECVAHVAVRPDLHRILDKFTADRALATDYRGAG